MENMEKKSQIDIAAKQLWQQIVNFQDLLFDNIHDENSAQLCVEYIKKSSDLARFIDKNFYNDID